MFKKIYMFFSQDSSGQQSVVEVLTEEVEEGRSALSPVTCQLLHI